MMCSGRPTRPAHQIALARLPHATVNMALKAWKQRGGSGQPRARAAREGLAPHPRTLFPRALPSLTQRLAVLGPTDSEVAKTKGCGAAGWV